MPPAPSRPAQEQAGAPGRALGSSPHRLFNLVNTVEDESLEDVELLP